jgi:hypothetical protein
MPTDKLIRNDNFGLNKQLNQLPPLWIYCGGWGLVLRSSVGEIPPTTFGFLDLVFGLDSEGNFRDCAWDNKEVANEMASWADCPPAIWAISSRRWCWEWSSWILTIVRSAVLVEVPLMVVLVTQKCLSAIAAMSGWWVTQRIWWDCPKWCSLVAMA